MSIIDVGTDGVERFATLARNLHDGPLQDVFATMLRLEALAHRAPPELTEELVKLSNLQRQIIRGMREVCGDTSVRDGRSPVDRVVDAITVASHSLGFSPRYKIDSAFDRVADEGVVNDVVFVVRESLSNIVRHANAGWVDVSLELTGDEIQLRVRDDGSGISPAARRGNGLANLRSRAERNGGSCNFATPPPNGTLVDWRVPWVFTGSGTRSDRGRGSSANSRRASMASR
jgi:signal transduction histidine kinase